MSSSRFSNLIRTITPIAMVAVLTLELSKKIYDSLSTWLASIGVNTQEPTMFAVMIFVAVIPSLLTGIGVETWGISAGDNYQLASDAGESRWSASLQLLAYVCLGVWMLWGAGALAGVPVVAALAYVSASFGESLQERVRASRLQETEASSYDLENRRAEDEHRRALEKIEKESEAQAKLAEIEAKARASIAKAQAKQAEARETLTKLEAKQAEARETSPEPTELSPKARQAYDALVANPGLTYTELEGMTGISRQYIGKISREFVLSRNGHAQGQ